ncbi:QWRF motif-containing protein 2-like, partial [Asparagus officinalis]|uniref:QWRF motif-containing protein 2-like n=1 Tax=Asparagus officinalis TaxID=4686 RepID=UPI00098E2B46
PLIPSEKDNATISSRRPRTKEITSRYLSSSSSTSTSTSYTSSSSNSTSSSASRRYPSPLLTPRPSTPTALSQSKRSHSVDRSRPSTPKSNPQETISNAARALCTTTRSLSVSFQGESFFYQTSKAKAASNSPNPTRKPTPERRRSDAKTENSKPVEHSHSRRWPAARSLSSSLTRSLDCSDSKKDPILATVRLLQQSSVLMEDGTRRVSFDGQMGLDSDSDSVSSGSNSGANEVSVPLRAKVTSRGISVPARFWQENGSRLRRIPEPGIKSPAIKRTLSDSPLSSPRSAASPNRPIRPSSPSKAAGSPARGMASPLRGRGNSSVMGSSSPLPNGQQVGNAPSIISFAAEVRRAKKGENRIEEAHLLRLLDNRNLQWRWVNARACAALMVQRLAAEKNLYNAWMATSELRDSVTRKRIKLQLLTQNLKLTSILKQQMTYLDEWSNIDRDHASSLSGATEALKASTLRLPVVSGARADLQKVKDAVSSAVDVMQAMGSSICSLLSKVEGTNSVLSELSKVAEQERGLLNQSRDLLSTIAAMHVKQCSLRGHILQLRCKPSQVQV